MDKQEKFIQLTETILQDTNLTMTEKVVVAQIIAFSNKTGICTASNDYITSCIHISERSLTRTLTNLKKLGYISVEFKSKKGSKSTWTREIKMNEINHKKPDKKVTKIEREVVAKCATTKGEVVAKSGISGSQMCDTNIIDNIIDNKNIHPRSDANASSLKDGCIATDGCFKENPNFFEEKEGINSTENIIPENKIINLWNKFSELSSHEKRNTKVYKRINKYLIDILDNNFKDYNFDKDWKIDNKIKLSKLNNITEREITDAIFDHVERFKEENKPTNKKYLAKSFDTFLYNPITKKSQFLYILNHSVEKIDEVAPRIQRKHLIPAIADKVDLMLEYKRTKISSVNRNKIYMNVNRVCKEFKPVVDVINLQKDNPNFIYVNTVEKLALEWLTFLDKKDTVKEIDFTDFSFEYKKFLEDIEVRYKISTDTSPRNRTFLKTREDRVKEVIKVDFVENDIYGLGE